MGYYHIRLAVGATFSVCILLAGVYCSPREQDNLAIFSLRQAVDNGLGDTTDLGKGDATGNSRDDGKFKSPSLRNIELTGPYMHDGRFATLERVVEFYNAEIRDTPNLHRTLRDDDGGPKRMGLDRSERQALVAFMKTLTDTTVLEAEKFSDPFEEQDSERVPKLPESHFNYGHNLPSHFEDEVVARHNNTPDANPTTDAGATLGRVLFYDPLLSSNETISCASCHSQADSFSDPRQFSVGFDGGETGRNSMPLINVAFHSNGRMFWDERAATLEEQVLLPIQDSVEMGLTLDELVTRVDDAGYYGPLFTGAFGDEEVTRDRIARALAQFVRSIQTSGSKWDRAVASAYASEDGDVDLREDFDSFSAEENRGKRIFFGRGGGGDSFSCARCHLPDGNERRGRGGGGRGPGNR